MRRLLTIISLACALTARSEGPAEAVVEARHGLWHIAELPYANPALNQWRMAIGLTEVKADYSLAGDNGEIDARRGRGEWRASGGAATYTKYRNTTLWGHGRYIKGKIRDVRWNETSDIDLIYPYLLADSVGGDIDSERYAFGGGYAAASGRWAWGAAMNYIATLEYRDIDPRPKNVAGMLDMAVGAAYRVTGNYFAGLSVNLRKYKQNNDIDFKSELGADKIFHLTGLGTHYNRFAGTGHSTYYNGYRYGATADLYPSDSRGAFVSCGVSRFTFDNILSDLNKLPMASVWHNEIKAEVGYMHPGQSVAWALSANFKAYRRHGTENIFGDATSSNYPQIAANTLFADNFCSAGAKGMVDISQLGCLRLAMTARALWSRRTVAYVEPWRYTLTNTLSYGLDAGGDITLDSDWSGAFGIGIETTSPLGCSADLPREAAGDELRGLQAVENRVYYLSSHAVYTPSAVIGVMRVIADKYVLKADVRWNTSLYAGGISSDCYVASLSLIF